jgi:hypothetical protein
MKTGGSEYKKKCNVQGKRKKGTFVPLILMSDGFLKTCFIALTSAKSPVRVDVA